MLTALFVVGWLQAGPAGIVLEIGDAEHREVARIATLEGKPASIDGTINGRRVKVKFFTEAERDGTIPVRIESEGSETASGTLRLDEELRTDVAGGLFVKLIRRVPDHGE